MLSVEPSIPLLQRLEKPLIGLNLEINPTKIVLSGPLSIDVETDEKDNFVGWGAYNGNGYVYYFTDLSTLGILKRHKLVGHNIKADLKWIKMWGVDLDINNVIYDTMLASYCQNPMRERHGLKSLADEVLHLPYPDYKEIVGKGRTRTTLNNQPLEIASKYNANDVVATYRLYQYFQRVLTPFQKSLLINLELPMMRLLLKMEYLGIQIDIEYLKELQYKFQDEYDILSEKLNKFGTINWGSPKQVKEQLEQYGIKLQSTDKKFLTAVKDKEPVKTLLEYRETAKLLRTYVEPLMKSERCHTTFSQLIDTGRLSSFDPNLQNIPTKTEQGNLLRKVFVSKVNYTLICADYSQIEYRLLAHFTQESILLKSYREGKDIHEETGKLLGVSRYIGKTCNFAAIYGAQAKKIMQTINSSKEGPITEEKCKDFLDTYWRKLPRVKNWIETIKDQARSKGYYQTLSGQRHRLTNIHSSDKLLRWHAERQAVNGTIQGSAAYIIKLAMLELEKQGLIPVLQVHDELLFEINPQSEGWGWYSDDKIKTIMENVVKLSVPLVVELGCGKSWQEAKS